jgi:hypothetical protein
LSELIFGNPNSRAKSRPSRHELIGWAILLVSLLPPFLVFPADVSTSEFLAHCQAAPGPCKQKVLAYVKFLADGQFIDPCVLQLPADAVAAKLIGYMRDHPAKEWIDCLDDAVATLKLCNP